MADHVRRVLFLMILHALTSMARGRGCEGHGGGRGERWWANVAPRRMHSSAIPGLESPGYGQSIAPRCGWGEATGFSICDLAFWIWSLAGAGGSVWSRSIKADPFDFAQGGSRRPGRGSLPADALAMRSRASLQRAFPSWSLGTREGSGAVKTGQGWSRWIKATCTVRPTRGHPRHAKLSFAPKGIPKLELGNEGNPRWSRLVKANQGRSRLIKAGRGYRTDRRTAFAPILKRRSSGALQERRRAEGEGLNSKAFSIRATGEIRVNPSKSDHRNCSRFRGMRKAGAAIPAGVGMLFELKSGGVAPSSLNPRLLALNCWSPPRPPCGRPVGRPLAPLESPGSDVSRERKRGEEEAGVFDEFATEEIRLNPTLEAGAVLLCPFRANRSLGRRLQGDARSSLCRLDHPPSTPIPLRHLAELACFWAFGPH